MAMASILLTRRPNVTGLETWTNQQWMPFFRGRLQRRRRHRRLVSRGFASSVLRADMRVLTGRAGTPTYARKRGPNLLSTGQLRFEDSNLEPIAQKVLGGERQIGRASCREGVWRGV